MPAIATKGKRVQVATYRVKYKDVFDMKKFYEDLHDWLAEKGWADLADPGSDHYETFYLEQVNPGGSKVITIKWRPQKIPEKNSYYRYWMDVNIVCIGLVNVDVVKDGVKLKVNKGEMEITITAYMDLDYRGEWSSHPILKFFNKMFPDRIFNKELFGGHRDELYRESYELQTFIKQWFKLKTFAPYADKTSFYPSHAWPSHLKEE
ncbi:hypothetical protein GOV03_04450 [Candidatus Woesearchaeota archaeon]|nr:hypothetical protein [Candidatus Woesearchaeota archaeon]